MQVAHSQRGQRRFPVWSPNGSNNVSSNITYSMKSTVLTTSDWSRPCGIIFSTKACQYWSVRQYRPGYASFCAARATPSFKHQVDSGHMYGHAICKLKKPESLKHRPRLARGTIPFTSNPKKIGSQSKRGTQPGEHQNNKFEFSATRGNWTPITLSAYP